MEVQDRADHDGMVDKYLEIMIEKDLIKKSKANQYSDISSD